MEDKSGAREKINSIYELTVKIGEINLKIEDIRYELNIMEQYTMSAILGEYDAHSKPKFANAESRSAEQCFRITNNEDYKKHREALTDFKKELITLSAELEREKNVLEVFFK